LLLSWFVGLAPLAELLVERERVNVDVRAATAATAFGRVLS
jgi:hypothetical protein